MITLRAADRPHPTWRQYLNPQWWINDDRIDPGWSRKGWRERNPCENAPATIIGVNHLERLTITSNGIDTWPPRGWQFGLTVTIRAFIVPVVLPLVAYRGSRWEWCAGWKMNGSFAMPIRRSGAKNATEVTPS